ncbi:MAG: hypothetical protein U0165_09035 [Polyangiaceae bacterium]
MFDPLSPVEIAPGTFWVGKRDPKSIFHSNPYLRVFDGVDPRTQQAIQFNILIDPGSSSDVAIVSAKIASVLGNVGRLSAIFINHQDPDVGSSAPMLTARHAPKASVVCSEDTWRLIVHTGLSRERFVPTDRYAHGLKLPTQHHVIPVPSPFCHFRGAVMLYDPQTRVLFSGDLFGGLTPEDAKGLDADLSDWAGMRAFHQLYMPATAALARAVDAIRRLDPPVEIIAPQHGRIIRGDLVREYMSRIEKLPVGLDVLDDDEDSLLAWNHVLQRVLILAREVLGPTAEARLAEDPVLADTVRFEPGGVVITSLGRWTVERSLEVLTDGESAGVSNLMKMEAMNVADQLQLPAPRINIEEQPVAVSASAALGGFAHVTAFREY